MVDGYTFEGSVLGEKKGGNPRCPKSLGRSSPEKQEADELEVEVEDPKVFRRRIRLRDVMNLGHIDYCGNGN